MDETNFAPDLPRFRLTVLPTPLERCERLEAALREEGVARVPRLYLKRDDVLSLGLGGNKIRNLEFSIGAAIADGATDVITMGRAQSNHCRLTAAASAKAGLSCHVVMADERPRRSTGNLLLTELLGAQVIFTGSGERAERSDRAARLADELRARGRRPYVVPVGGSDARGAVGHALLALELLRQFEEIGDFPDVIALATATGGTQAGLLAGRAKLRSSVRVTGFTVNAPAREAASTVLALANEVAAEVGGSTVRREDVHVDESALGAGYGIPSQSGDAAIALLARTEGVIADPVYTGKALGGLLGRLRAGSLDADAAVFIHTGGAPALFARLPATTM